MCMWKLEEEARENSGMLLLLSWKNSSINLTSSQVRAAKDKAASTNLSLNFSDCLLIHSSCTTGTPKLVWDTPRPSSLYLKTSFLKFLTLFLQTFLSVPLVQPLAMNSFSQNLQLQLMPIYGAPLMTWLQNTTSCPRNRYNVRTKC